MTNFVGSQATTYKKILNIQDTPWSLATGAAIGIFFGFSPFFGLKTLLAVGVSWLLRANKLAAMGAIALHGIFLPFLPMLYRLEYDLGYWIESEPHQFPAKIDSSCLHPLSWLHWSTFYDAGRPILIGSAVLGGPLALLTYLIVRLLLVRKNKRREAV